MGTPTTKTAVPVVGCTFTQSFPNTGVTSTVNSGIIASLRTLGIVAYNQYLFNWGGQVGDGFAVSTGGGPVTSGDTNYTNSSDYNFASVDAKVNVMQQVGAIASSGTLAHGIGMVSLAMAPWWMEGIASGASGNTNVYTQATTNPVQPGHFQDFANYCRAVVNRYIVQGVHYFPVWSDLKGFFTGANQVQGHGGEAGSGGWDIEGFTSMYNAIWTTIKNDHTLLSNGYFTSDAQLGGPGQVMENYQPGQQAGSGIASTSPGNDDKGNPIPPCCGNNNSIGNWGAVNQHVLYCLLYWKHNAAGWDFLDVNLTSYNHLVVSGSSNPDSLSDAIMVQYFADVTDWLYTNIANGLPIVSSETYGHTAATLGQALTLFGQHGGDAYFIWNQPTVNGSTGAYTDGGPGGTLMDQAGNTNASFTGCLGAALSTWNLTSTPNSLLSPNVLGTSGLRTISTPGGTGAGSGGGGTTVVTNIPAAPNITVPSNWGGVRLVMADDFNGNALSPIWTTGMTGQKGVLPAGWSYQPETQQIVIYSPNNVTVANSKVTIQAKPDSITQTAKDGTPNHLYSYSSGIISSFNTGIAPIATTGFQWVPSQTELIIQASIAFGGSDSNSSWGAFWADSGDIWTLEYDFCEQAGSGRNFQSNSHYASGSNTTNSNVAQSGDWGTQPTANVPAIYTIHTKTDGSWTVALNGNQVSSLPALSTTSPAWNATSSGSSVALLLEYAFAANPPNGWTGDTITCDYVVVWQPVNVAAGTGYTGGGVAPLTLLPGTTTTTGPSSNPVGIPQTPAPIQTVTANCSVPAAATGTLSKTLAATKAGSTLVAWVTAQSNSTLNQTFTVTPPSGSWQPVTAVQGPTNKLPFGQMWILPACPTNTVSTGTFTLNSTNGASTPVNGVTGGLVVAEWPGMIVAANPLDQSSSSSSQAAATSATVSAVASNGLLTSATPEIVVCGLATQANSTVSGTSQSLTASTPNGWQLGGANTAAGEPAWMFWQAANNGISPGITSTLGQSNTYVATFASFKLLTVSSSSGTIAPIQSVNSGSASATTSGTVSVTLAPTSAASTLVAILTATAAVGQTFTATAATIGGTAWQSVTPNPVSGEPFEQTFWFSNVPGSTTSVSFNATSNQSGVNLGLNVVEWPGLLTANAMDVSTTLGSAAHVTSSTFSLGQQIATTGELVIMGVTNQDTPGGTDTLGTIATPQGWLAAGYSPQNTTAAGAQNAYQFYQFSTTGTTPTAQLLLSSANTYSGSVLVLKQVVGTLNSTGLIPDYFMFDSTQRPFALTADTNGNKDNNYGYDAFRVLIRVMWDYIFYGETRALAVLSGNLKTFFTNYWAGASSPKFIPATFTHTGSVIGNFQASYFTEAVVQALTANDPSNATASAIYAGPLASLYATGGSGAYFQDAPGSLHTSYYNDVWTTLAEIMRSGVWMNFLPGATVQATPTAEPNPVSGVTLIQDGPTPYLVWNPQTAGQVTSYAIYRDGQRITTTPGAPWYDTTVGVGAHSWDVAPVNIVGEGSQSGNPWTATLQLPPPPSGVVVISVQGNSVTLQWNNVLVAANFIIDLGGANIQTVANPGGTVVTTVLTNVPNGVPQFSVQSQNGLGTGLLSGTAQTTVPQNSIGGGSAVPLAPTNVSAGYSDGVLTINWTSVSSVTGYYPFVDGIQQSPVVGANSTTASININLPVANHQIVVESYTTANSITTTSPPSSPPVTVSVTGSSGTGASILAEDFATVVSALGDLITAGAAFGTDLESIGTGH